MNLASDHHDNIIQSTIKDEKTDYHVNNPLKISSNSIDTVDQPLLIVLDEDDTNLDDENEQINITIPETTLKDDLSQHEGQKTTSSNRISPTAKQSLNQSKSLPESFSNSLIDSKLFRRPQKSRLSPTLSDEKFIRTVVIDSSFMRQTYQKQRTKLIARRKHLNTFSSSLMMSNTKSLSLDDNSHVLSSTDSILSNISFDNVSDVLTVSRMGSIFYCLEDLYSKVFVSLCTLDELNSLLIKPDKIPVKEVTLSEKISIEKQYPSLKKLQDRRYRLISINSSDYVLKLKQLLLTIKNLDENEEQQRGKRIEQIIDEMHSYKRTPTPVLLKDNVSHSSMTTKRLSSDDDDDDDDDEDEHEQEPRKCLKIVTKKQKSNEAPPLAPTQFGIFIQCNGPVSCNIFSTNENVPSTNNTAETTTTTSTTVAKTDPEISTKTTIIKKQNDNENKQSYFEKFQHHYQNIPKFNRTNEQIHKKSAVLNRTNSESPTDYNQLNKLCPSSTITNMPMKRRILNSYNSDTSDSSSTTAVHISTSSVNSLRCSYRSKSFTCEQKKNLNYYRRSSSSPAIIYASKTKSSEQKFLPTEISSKSTMKSKTEPIDLTDESYSMPMIVNVEENVELANQRQRIKNKKLPIPNKSKPSELNTISMPEPRSTTTTISRPISHESSPPVLTKPSPTHQFSSSSSSSYRATPFVVYHHQESYTYRDPTHTIPTSTSVPHSYLHSTAVPHSANLYPYSYPTSAQYPVFRKSKDSSASNTYETRPNSVAPLHPSSSSSSSSSSTSLSTAVNTNNNHHHHPHSSLPSSVVMPIVRKPNYFQQLTPEQQASIKMQTSPPASTPCRLSCCYQPPSMLQHHSIPQNTTDKTLQNERYMYRPYSAATPVPHTFKRDSSQVPDVVNSAPSMSRKQRRIDSVQSLSHPPPPLPSTTPYPSYPSTKPYFVPPPLASTSTSSAQSSVSSSASHWPSSLSSPIPNSNIKPSIRYPYPSQSNIPMNGMTRKPDSYLSSFHPPPPPPSSQPRRPIPLQSRPPLTTPVIAQNSSALISPPNTPHELTLPNIRTRSVDLQRAIAERGYCDMDKLPKLVVRHTKTYSNKATDTMGQLFPTWFNEPDYRCIHCFRCDQVFTPQQFMTHVDDEHLQNEQPLSMTSIQLLTSEKMSEYKVGLWNQFCTNLTIYAREGRIGGFSTNRNL